MLASERLPALDGDIDVGRVKLDREAVAPAGLGRDDRGPRSREGFVAPGMAKPFRFHCTDAPEGTNEATAVISAELPAFTTIRPPWVSDSAGVDLSDTTAAELVTDPR